jgi:hypothetical protein
VLLVSSSLSAMEITQNEIDSIKPILIQNKQEELSKKLASQKRLLNFCVYASGSALLASVAAKFGYISTDRIGSRGYLLIASGFGLLSLGGASSVGKFYNELKNVPELINNDYVRIHLLQIRKPKI